MLVTVKPAIQIAKLTTQTACVHRAGGEIQQTEFVKIDSILLYHKSFNYSFENTTL